MTLPLWIISIDLSKACDKLKHSVLFKSLWEAGLPEPYVALIQELYSEQEGVVDGSFFNIQRGVRQGDILSPLLFNTTLEFVMKRWKARLRDCGLQIDDLPDALTNVRYADDLLLFGKSLPEVLHMLEVRVLELNAAGLSMNGTKTKLLTTDSKESLADIPLLVEVAGTFVELVRGQTTHKYLGKKLSGDLLSRKQCNLDFRLSCAWMKYDSIAPTLLNKRIPVHLRLRLFDSIVSPAALYSLTSTPLTTSQLRKLDVAQHRMLRRIVGWIRFDDESWEETGRRMKTRLQCALQSFPISDWSAKRLALRNKLISKVQTGMAPKLLGRVFNWSLAPGTGSRRVGRPVQRWRD